MVRKYNSAEIKELYKEYEKGKTLEELEYSLGISRQTLSKWFREEHLFIRKRWNKIYSRISVDRSNIKYGEEHYRWKGGRSISKTNRIFITVDRKSYLESRYVWEFYNGTILKGYLIHHKDLNPENNDIMNLEMMTYKEHSIIHKKIKMEKYIYINDLINNRKIKMEPNVNTEEAIYANIDKRVKDRVVAYITESKLSGNKKTDSIKGLIEEALDEYMIKHSKP